MKRKHLIKAFGMILGLAVLVVLAAGCDDNGGGGGVDYSVRPVVFVHGYFGSASQFESQAQRFIANAYPASYLEAYEHDTGGPDPVEQAPENNARLNEIIDSLLAESGADKVDLIAHSRGGYVAFIFLADPQNAAKVAHYVNVDSRSGDAPPGGVPTLALWGMGNEDREITGAQNVYISDQSHIQVCTSAESFARMYEFFNDRPQRTTEIKPVKGEEVEIAGKVNIFPENVGAAGTELQIYEVDRDTGFRMADEPVAAWEIGEDGAWGPQTVKKGAAYEFALVRETAGSNHYFYREPFYADNYFVRFNTSRPGEGLGAYLPRSENHTNVLIGRDKEFWGDQGIDNDYLLVDGYSVATANVAPQAKRLSTLFIFDWDKDMSSDLLNPNPFFHSIPFMSGLDLFLPGATPPNRTIAIKLIPRGGNDKIQEVNVPNWSSDVIRSISVQFRDFVR